MFISNTFIKSRDFTFLGKEGTDDISTYERQRCREWEKNQILWGFLAKKQ